jgi:hypothetical protein
VLREISCPDSQLYAPAEFAQLTNQQQIIDDVTAFGPFFLRASVWFPSNGWVFDKTKKYDVVGSNGKKAYHYRFAVEMQFRETRLIEGEERSSATNDCWSFFVNEDLTKFFQIKEFFDFRIATIQKQRIEGTQIPILIVDENNINLLPFPPINPAVTINSIKTTVDATLKS